MIFRQELVLRNFLVTLYLKQNGIKLILKYIRKQGNERNTFHFIHFKLNDNYNEDDDIVISINKHDISNNIIDFNYFIIYYKDINDGEDDWNFKYSNSNTSDL